MSFFDIMDNVKDEPIKKSEPIKKVDLKKPPKPPTPPKKKVPREKVEPIISDETGDIAGKIISNVANSTDFRRLIIGITNNIVSELGLKGYKTSTRTSEKVMESSFTDNINEIRETFVETKDIRSQLRIELKDFIQNGKLESVKRKEYTKEELLKLAEKASKIILGSKRTQKLNNDRKIERS